MGVLGGGWAVLAPTQTTTMELAGAQGIAAEAVGPLAGIKIVFLVVIVLLRAVEDRRTSTSAS